jgi:hypothetical protein
MSQVAKSRGPQMTRHTPSLGGRNWPPGRHEYVNADRLRQRQADASAARQSGPIVAAGRRAVNEGASEVGP